MAIEEEIVHWYKKEDGSNSRSALRIESELPTTNNAGYPQDGLITVRLLNGAGSLGFRLNPEEALKLSTLLLSVAKDLMNTKRELWKKRGD